MDITKDIRPLTEFKRDTARVVAHLKETGRPSVLTVNGKPALVVMDAQAWQEMQDEIEFARTVTGIRNGLEQADRGQGVEAGALFRKLKKTKA
ncbi:MAG: type II toxin-antitoxin system Phd/YefM family antitoxin [Pseudomonadota bacterium]